MYYCFCSVAAVETKMLFTVVPTYIRIGCIRVNSHNLKQLLSMVVLLPVKPKLLVLSGDEIILPARSFAVTVLPASSPVATVPVKRLCRLIWV